MRKQKILCPVDFSPSARVALDRAIELARATAAELTIVNVFSVPYYDGVVATAEILEKIREAAQQGVAAWAAEARAQDVAADATTLMGVAWDEIVGLARARGSDLIVMGTHGRSGLKRALIGSVAEKVVRHAPCTVMVVRAPEGARAAAAA